MKLKNIFLIILTVLNLLHFEGAPDFFASGFNQLPRKGTSSADNEYYKILGVKSTASADQIKKAYRDKARILHPDKGGDEEQFKRLVHAYEILSDPKKKEDYDKYGKGGTASFNRFDPYQNSAFGSDIFRQFMNSMPVTAYLDVSLEDLFNGRVVNLSLPNSKSSMKISIIKGMMGGQEFIQRGGAGNGADLIVKLRERPHRTFKRKNADLQITIDISLREAFFGFSRTIKHLDGKSVTFTTSVGEITQPDSLMVLDDLGMPFYDRRAGSSDSSTVKRGKLFVLVKCKLPKQMWLSGKDASVLESLLTDPMLSGTRRPSLFPEESASFTSSEESSTGRFDGASGDDISSSGLGAAVGDLWKGAKNAWFARRNSRIKKDVEADTDFPKSLRDSSSETPQRVLRKANPSAYGLSGASTRERSSYENDMGNIFSQMFF